jgi:hypothetical protein
MCLDVEYRLLFLHDMVNQFESTLEVSYLSHGKSLDMDSNSYHKENDVPSHESDHQLELNQNSDLVHMCLDVEYLLFFLHEMVNQFGLVLKVKEVMRCEYYEARRSLREDTEDAVRG